MNLQDIHIMTSTYKIILTNSNSSFDYDNEGLVVLFKVRSRHLTS